MVIKVNLMDKNKRYNSIDRYYKAKYGKITRIVFYKEEKNEKDKKGTNS